METVSLVNKLKEHYGASCFQQGDNHWIFEINTKSGRSQLVHLFYKKQIISGKDISRFIAVSPIGPVHNHFEYEKTLRKNYVLDVGAICIEDIKVKYDSPTPYLVYRSSHLASTIDYEEAWELIDKTGTVADQLEEELFAVDSH